ncbi:MAG: hypothetical protein HQL84_09955 [Magnetococcales bacterium]|nr:hypothetical protein [Magnetococcales bacterium]MBF0150354.1 hypothetical protein [Magnetococcales bacterium]MBF0632148.1 hypothetical protein [Magnetococcales bacterium]
MIQPMTTEQLQAARVGDALWHAYPGYRWAVAICGGLARIRNLDLSGQWGFDIPLANLNHDPLLKGVIRAGGEILERYRLARRGADADELNTLPRWITGEAKGDLST